MTELELLRQIVQQQQTQLDLLVTQVWMLRLLFVVFIVCAFAALVRMGAKA